MTSIFPSLSARKWCHRLRCQIPHHVQQFFDNLHEHLRRANRREASLEDVDRVYTTEMLGCSGSDGSRTLREPIANGSRGQRLSGRLRYIDRGPQSMTDCYIAMPSINIMSTFKLKPTRFRSRTFSVCSNMTAIWRDKGTTIGSYRAYLKLGGTPGTPGPSSP